MNLKELLQQVRTRKCYVFHENRSTPFLTWAQHVAGFRNIVQMAELSLPNDAGDSVLVVGCVMGQRIDTLVGYLEEHHSKWNIIFFLQPRRYDTGHDEKIGQWCWIVPE